MCKILCKVTRSYGIRKEDIAKMPKDRTYREQNIAMRAGISYDYPEPIVIALIRKYPDYLELIDKIDIPEEELKPKVDKYADRSIYKTFVPMTDENIAIFRDIKTSKYFHNMTRVEYGYQAEKLFKKRINDNIQKPLMLRALKMAMDSRCSIEEIKDKLPNFFIEEAE